MGMTLREMTLYAEGKAKVTKEAFRKQITVAHLSEVMARRKQVPDLEGLLKAYTADPLTPLQKRENFLLRMDMMVAATQAKFGKKKKAK